MADARTVPSPPGPRLWLLWAAAVTAIGIMAGVLILGLASAELEPSTLRIVLVGWIAVPYVISGLIAWWRRPQSRLGPLMILTGAAMALTPLQWSGQPVLHSIGHLFDMVPAAMFLHVFLAFPTGRLTGRPDRILVGCCYAITLGLQALKVAVGANPESVFVVATIGWAAALVEGVQLSVVALCLLLGVVILFRRWSHAGPARRRPATLVVDTFGFALVMLALLYVAGLLAWPALEVIRLTTFAALGLAPIAFLFALLDLRLARGDVAGLLVELRADPTTDLQAPLARALRDPSLRLVYWLPEFGSWADQSGAPTPTPAADEHRAVRILYRDSEPMAAVSFDRSQEEEVELLDAVLATAAIALENGRLRAELRARLAELQGSRIRVLEAGRTERQRLERDLHDGAQVRLVALSLELDLLGTDPHTDPELKTRLQHAKHEVTMSLGELRDVAHGLYPAVLSGHGLSVALESLVARAAVPVQLDSDLRDRPPEAVEVAAYYVISEALANIGKHAEATAAIVRVSEENGNLVAEISDNGRGGVQAGRGSGLRGLRDRIEALGGRLDISDDASGGVRVRAELPWR